MSMFRTGVLLAACAVCTSTACRSTTTASPGPNKQASSHPPTVALAATTATSASNPSPPSSRIIPNNLEESLSFTEVTDDKPEQRFQFKGDRHLPEVDYESKLQITPDREALKKLFSGHKAVLPEIAQDVREKIKQGGILVETAKDYVSKAQEVNRLLTESGNPDSEKIKQAINEQATLGKKVLKPVQAIVEAEAKAKFGTTTGREASQYIRSRTDGLFMDSNKNDVILNLDEFGKFFAALQPAVNQANRDMDIAAEQGTTQLRLRAWLRTRRNDPLAISVENYDDINDPKGAKTPRIAMQMRPEDQDRVAEGQRLNEAILASYHEFKTNRDLFRINVNPLLAKLKTQLQQITLLPASVIKNGDTVRTIQQLVAHYENNVEYTERLDLQELKKILQSVDGFKTQIAGVNLGFTNLKTAASTAPPGALLEMTLSIPRNFLEDTIPKLVELMPLSNGLNSALQGLAVLMKRVSEDAAQKAVTQAKTDIEEFLQGLQAYKEITALFTQLATESQPSHLADQINHAKLDPRVKPVDLDKANTGTIHLNNVPADKGDRIELLAEVLTSNKGEEQVLERSSQTLKVERFGWTDTFSAPLIFVKRLSTPQGDPSVNFSPRPSASWTLHYKPRIVPETGGEKRVLDFLSPGLGINVAALDFTNNGVQVGLGVQASIFKELLTLGYGYNLNVSEKREYFFLGIGVLELLETVGIRNK